MFSSYNRTSIARNLFGGTSAALLTAISALGLSLATTSAGAQETMESPQTVVRYADLNLAKAEDASEMYRRLQRAARSVCRDYSSRQAYMVAKERACYQEALASAVADVDHAALTALYRRDGYGLVAQRPGARPSGS